MIARLSLLQFISGCKLTAVSIQPCHPWYIHTSRLVSASQCKPIKANFLQLGLLILLISHHSMYWILSSTTMKSEHQGEYLHFQSLDSV